MVVTHDVWAVGAGYESYVGRWSRLVAARFLAWLAVPAGRRWLDLGCGTGALTHTVLATVSPAQIAAVDPSVGFLTTARARAGDPRTGFLAADARALPLADGRFDAVVSGLALNFIPDPGRVLAECARVSVAGGTVAAYVWDYAGTMELMQHFWAAAAVLDPGVAGLDEGKRFPLCRPGPLRELWSNAGLADVVVEPIDFETGFADFADYWDPFLAGQGPAPGYVMSLPATHRDELRDLLRVRLPAGPDGSIRLTARAWAVRGRV